MTNNEKIETLRVLQEQMNECRSIIQESDARASKCVKLNLNFAEKYPEEQQRYELAREEYNRLEEEYNRVSAIEPEEEPHEPTE